MHSFYFKNIKVSCCTIESAADEVFSHLKSGKPDYICVTDVGNVVNACRNNPELKIAINNSMISLPDGRPLSVFSKFIKTEYTERVAGPDFMEEIFKRTSGTDLVHFLLGDTDEIHTKIKQKAFSDYNIKITESYSPEFGEWNEKTNEEILRRINSAKPDFIWVSLGGGRQEIWMNRNYNKLDKGIMTGVGAAFRFYTGDIKRAPELFQKLGLEWMFRLMQQPGKMFTRYAATFPYFIYYAFQEYYNQNFKK